MTAPVTVPAMSDTPPFPALSDRAAGTYNSKAYDFGTHMSDVFNAELVAVANSARTNAVSAEESATAAAASAGAANTSKLAAASSASDANASKLAAATSASDANASKLAAAQSAADAATVAAGLKATSTTSLAVGYGAKAFTTQAGKQFGPGNYIMAVSASNSANWMCGPFVSYAGTALAIDSQLISGSGTVNDWVLSLSGVPVAGPPGTGITPQTTGFTVTGGTTPKTFTADVDLVASNVVQKSGGSMTGALNDARATVASHATTGAIWSALGNQIDWTGTATTTIFPNAPQAGAERTLICAAACSFTAGANMLIDGVNSGSTVTCAVNDKVVVRAISTTQFMLSRIKYDGTPQVAPPSTPSLVRSARTSNTILGVADKATQIDITSGTFSQTFTAAATLGNGWWCEYKNSGTGDITLDPNGTETIDGMTSFIMYPGEMRRILCDGTSFYSIVLNSFYRKWTTTATNNFTRPPGYKDFSGFVKSGGQGGGLGSSGLGARGGSGGGNFPFTFPSSLFAAQMTFTIGAGGVGTSTPNASGPNGGDSSLGSLVLVRGGTTSLGGAVSIGGVQLQTTAAQCLGFETSSKNDGTGISIYGGATSPSFTAASYTMYGGPSGGSTHSNGGSTFPPGANALGATGGAASTTGIGGNGVGAGAGGGASSTGSKAGDGIAGEIEMWGVF